MATQLALGRRPVWVWVAGAACLLLITFSTLGLATSGTGQRRLSGAYVGRSWTIETVSKAHVPLARPARVLTIRFGADGTLAVADALAGTPITVTYTTDTTGFRSHGFRGLFGWYTSLRYLPLENVLVDISAGGHVATSLAGGTLTLHAADGATVICTAH